MAQEYSEIVEFGFRRGYYRGFTDALQAMSELAKVGTSFDEYFEDLVVFATVELGKWQVGNVRSATPPPRFQGKRTITEND